MKCPYCQHLEDKVVDSRETPDGTMIRRRRECVSCGRRYTTYEVIEGVETLKVIKKDGRRENFDRTKALGGILKAIEKRPVSVENSEQIISDLESYVFKHYEKEVPAQTIGEFIMQRLEKLDHIAYVRFASIYRDFQDINQLYDEVRSLLKKKTKRNGKA